jgi:hypothetical protein
VVWNVNYSNIGKYYNKVFKNNRGLFFLLNQLHLQKSWKWHMSNTNIMSIRL